MLMESFPETAIFSLPNSERLAGGVYHAALTRHAFSGIALGDRGITRRAQHPCSNDCLTDELMDTLNRRGGRDQIALSVGTGHTYSLLQHLRPEHTLIIDKDITTLRLYAMLGHAILRSTSYDEVVQHIHALPPDDMITPEAKQRLEEELQSERKHAGEYHWANDMSGAQEALMSHPPVFVCANINDPNLGAGLRQLSEDTGLAITYANFTNVASWQALTNRPVDFAKYWPLTDDTLVLSSDKVVPGEKLTLRPSLGLDGYVTRTKTSAFLPAAVEPMAPYLSARA